MSTNKGSLTQKESLARNKGMVLQAMATKLTNKFKNFCKEPMMDNFLIACIEYFTVYFEVQKQKTPVPNPDDAKGPASSAAPAAPIKVDPKLEMEAHNKLRVMATVYATILLDNSNYANTQQERQFFESLYDFSARVLFVINDRKRWQMIENELSRIFRSDHFNLSLRKNEQSAKGGTARGGYREQYERGEFASKPAHTARRSSIHHALLIRSPIISTIFPTPKERAQRAAELAMQGDDAEGEGTAPPSAPPAHRHPPPEAHVRREEDELRAQNTLGRGFEGEEAMDAEIAMAERSFDALTK